MSHAAKKAAADCNGEIMEAIHNIPLLAVNGLVSDEALAVFNEMKPRWAQEYLAWKAEFLFNGDDDDN